VCILAGGLGTRLGARVSDTPKPLVDVAGEPFLFHQLRLLARYGLQRVVLCVGYLGEMIERRVGRDRFGIAIQYSHDAPGLDGTLGAVRRAAPLLGERFLVLYGDTYLRIDYAEFTQGWRRSGLPAAMAVFRNDDRWDVSNVRYSEGRVVEYDKAAPTPGMRWIDYGLGGLESWVLDLAPASVRELPELHHRLAKQGYLYGFEATERFYEIGSAPALAETEAFLRGDASAR
jgi:NDP-sugar pyrophosphorylase family protein